MGKQDQQVRFQCLIFQQKGETIYQFHMNADQLERFGHIDRFGDSSEGVNRMYDQRHAKGIAEGMSKPGVLMLENINGQLVGDWRYENVWLIPGPGAFLSIDDGQHRQMALTQHLSPEERAVWAISVNATMGRTVEERIQTFRQQRKRKPIDSKLDLAMRYTTDDWDTPQEREAYKLLLELNSNPNSPLQGMIILDETVVRTYEHIHRPEGISAAGLFQVIVSAMSKKSPLYTMSVEKRVDVIRTLIFVAAETWPDAWKSSGHVLATSRGVSAIVKLLVSSKQFQIACSNAYTPAAIRQTFALIKRFNWTQAKWQRCSPKDITDNLDDAIGAGLIKSLGHAVA